MFDYQFPSRSFFSFFNPWAQDPLIKSIQIQGPFITIYGRKTVGEELSVVLKELKGRVIQPDFQPAEHFISHDKVQVPFWWNTENPHVHYVMADSSVTQGITHLITALFQRNNPAIREEDYQKIVAGIESDRIRNGDAELPPYVKKALAQIDTKSPFFLSPDSQALILDILSKYGEYCTKPSNDRCRELLQMYIIGPLKPVLSIYYDEDDEVKGEEKKRIELLLAPLKEMEEYLETARQEPYNIEVFQEIQDLFKEVNVEELVKLENRDDNYPTEAATLQERLDFISRYAQERVQTIEEYQKTSWYYFFSSRISQTFYSVFPPVKPRTA
jgi:hypothetical protein